MKKPGEFKILTVDDDEEIRCALSELLSTEGFQTIHAKNGRVALDYLLATNPESLPDLILLDFMMPVMDGNTFCRNLHSNQRLSHIPVVVMSAGGNMVQLMDQIDLEADAYLSKPMDIDSILNLVEFFNHDSDSGLAD